MFIPSLEAGRRKPAAAGIRLMAGGVAVKSPRLEHGQLLCIRATPGSIQVLLTMSGVDPVTKGE
jgi:hypothetical protein